MPNLDILPLTTRELADQSGEDARQIRRLIVRGELSFLKKNPGRTGGYLFDPTAPDVRALIAKDGAR